MIKFLVGAMVALGMVSQARAEVQVNLDFQAIQQSAMMSAKAFTGLKWKVGDQADYKIAIGGFINGTSHTFVSKDEGAMIWEEEDMNLGMGQAQKVEIQFEKATGQVKKILANGQDQALPDSSKMKVIDMHEDNVTVVAGTFKCIYVKIHDSGTNQDQEAWINPQQIPLSGVLKVNGQSQFGPVTQELTKFSFAP